MESVALEASTQADPERVAVARRTLDGATLRVPGEGVAGAEIEVPEPSSPSIAEIIRRLTGLDVTQFPLTAVKATASGAIPCGSKRFLPRSPTVS